MAVYCEPEVDSSGVRVKLYTSPVNIPKGVYCQYKYSISDPQDVGAAQESSPVTVVELICAKTFQVGRMAGGWDAAAWASSGLPTEGDVPIKLKVFDVWP
jgi:hypothetical protein